MSNLPLGFLAPWQPKHDSLKIGATSLMKLTGAGGWAFASGGETITSAARAAATTAQSRQKQKRDRSMAAVLLGRVGKGLAGYGNGREAGLTPNIVPPSSQGRKRPGRVFLVKDASR